MISDINTFFLLLAAVLIIIFVAILYRVFVLMFLIGWGVWFAYLYTGNIFLAFILGAAIAVAIDGILTGLALIKNGWVGKKLRERGWA